MNVKLSGYWIAKMPIVIGLKMFAGGVTDLMAYVQASNIPRAAADAVPDVVLKS